MFSTNYHLLSLLLLVTSLSNHTMEIQKPLIKATVYLKEENPAFYATKEQIEYLNLSCY
ncbi:MAG TPA: hypothetical protein VKU36_02885 [Candidatus Babeliales bacterium]|nr:hypothetical protein [Candidatus Babeliales bacterium]